MKTIILGQAPAKDGNAIPLINHKSGKMLAALAGISQPEMQRAFELRNLLDAYPGAAATGKGDAFPVREGRAAARHLLPKLRGRQVVMLGVRVCYAFEFCPQGFFRWQPHRHMQCAAMPHPSGISSWWKDPSNIKAAQKFMRDVTRLTTD